MAATKKQVLQARKDLDALWDALFALEQAGTRNEAVWAAWKAASEGAWKLSMMAKADFPEGAADRVLDMTKAAMAAARACGVEVGE